MLSKIIDLIKRNPRKSVVIFLVTVAIIIIIIIFSSKKSNETAPETEKQIVQNRLKTIMPLFNLSTTETFNDTLVFNKTNDIIKNLKSFFMFAFPKLDYNELNKRLKENNVDLTAFEIFEKHKNDDIKTNLDKYAVLAQNFETSLYSSYAISRVTLSDMDYNKNIVKLMFIMSTMTSFLFYNDFNEIQNTIKYIINKDYLTNDTINIYLKTKINESIDYKEAITFNENVSICYMDAQLCKKSIDINNLIMSLKPRITTETIKLNNDLFYILMTKFLMDLENIDTTKMYENYMTTSQELYQLYQRLLPDNNMVTQPLSDMTMPTYPDMLMPTFPTTSLLDETLKAFNIKVDEPSSVENFEVTSSNVDTIVFNTKDDIINNMMDFFGYLYPKMNSNDINNLLQQYNNNKTMQEILNENKNKIYIEDIPYSVMYEDYVYDETDNSKIADNIRAFKLIIILISSINLKYNINDFINSVLIDSNRTLPSNKSNITYINIVVPNDFKTNNIMRTYFKTNYTEDLQITNEEPSWNGSNGIECLTSQLCTIGADIDIQNNYINPLGKWAVNNMDKIKMQFNLSMVHYLLQLNGSDTTKIYNDFDKLRKELYDSRLEWINTNENNTTMPITVPTTTA
jgi:hypothetical protein